MSSPTQSATELRLYQVDSNDGKAIDSASDDLWNQIPALPELIECFESVTGWELAFKEKRSNLARRQAQGSDAILHGKLEIIDLSNRIEPGQVVVPRQRCNALADVISELVTLLQENRENFQALNQQTTPVVDTPFEWWGIAGQTGFRNGHISNWSITPNEQIRLFSAQVSGNDATDQMIAASALLAAFESTCQIGVELNQVSMLLPRILRSGGSPAQRLERFANVEMDPITGEFQIDGYEAASCVALLDLSARALVNLEAENLEGVLCSGQVLMIGLTDSQRKDLLEVISNTEMAPPEFRRIFERKFADAAALFLYRK